LRPTGNRLGLFQMARRFGCDGKSYFFLLLSGDALASSEKSCFRPEMAGFGAAPASSGAALTASK
jgi:hypothetical protein